MFGIHSDCCPNKKHFLIYIHFKIDLEKICAKCDEIDDRTVKQIYDLKCAYFFLSIGDFLLVLQALQS